MKKKIFQAKKPPRKNILRHIKFQSYCKKQADIFFLAFIVLGNFKKEFLGLMKISYLWQEILELNFFNKENF